MSLFLPLFQNLSASLAYLFLILSIISVWINRRIWIWGALAIISLALAYYGHVIELKALIPIGLLFLCQAALTQDIDGFWRLFAALIAAMISIALLTHMIAGVHNILLVQNWHGSLDGASMNFYINYDKPFIGLFVLGLLVPLIEGRKRFFIVLTQSILWFVLTAIVLIGLAYSFDLVVYDPKIPAITLMWIILQIFFVCIPEEAFLRGFLQHEITKDLHNFASGFLAILIVSLLSSLLHLFFQPHLSYVFIVFIANIMYGAIFYFTKSIESSILVHFLTNTTHFFFFTYPFLK